MARSRELEVQASRPQHQLQEHPSLDLQPGMGSLDGFTMEPTGLVSACVIASKDPIGGVFSGRSAGCLLRLQLRQAQQATGGGTKRIETTV